MSPTPGVLNTTGRRKAVFHLFLLFYGTRDACAGCIGYGVPVCEQPSYCLVPLKSEVLALEDEQETIS